MWIARRWHTATLLPDGTVLIAGGTPDLSYNATPLAELYFPSSGAFSSLMNMNTARASHQATLLRDGRVLITGGLNSNTYPNYQTLAIAKLYTPAVLAPPLVVSGLQFDRTNVGAGSSYSVSVSGSNLTGETFFDVRFRSPGSSEFAVVLNWQRGLVANHDVPASIASGNWTINGVRAHEIETDHTGSFFPVNARITVSP
jgi:hypothetical protein